MKQIEIKCRENSSFLSIGQLYGIINNENDIHVNGSVTVNGSDFENHSHIKIYVNLCKEDGAILSVLSSYKNYTLVKKGYYSFSSYCADISRYFDVKELSYAEVYVIFDEKD